MNNPLSDAPGMIKKDWKLLASINALYFCVIVIGAVIALMSPGLHLSMVQLIGAGTLASPATPSSMAEALENAGYGFASSFFLNTLAMITIPSIVMPIWAPIIGATRFFIWGVTYVCPGDGTLTLQMLLPQYVAMFLEGEAYIIAIFACVRQLAVALGAADGGLRIALKEYVKAALDNLKLLAIVVVLLAAASLYRELLVPLLNGLL